VGVGVALSDEHPMGRQQAQNPVEWVDRNATAHRQVADRHGVVVDVVRNPEIRNHMQTPGRKTRRGQGPDRLVRLRLGHSAGRAGLLTASRGSVKGPGHGGLLVRRPSADPAGTQELRSGRT